MERVAFLLHVKEGCEEEYIKRHRSVWPEVLQEMEQAGIYSMNIYLAGRRVIIFMEVENYAHSVQLLSKAPASNRWEEFMAPIMEGDSGNAYDPENAWPAGLPEVFHWKAAEKTGGR
jgi:L-rhamnose mutarotase